MNEQAMWWNEWSHSERSNEANEQTDKIMYEPMNIPKNQSREMPACEMENGPME